MAQELICWNVFASMLETDTNVYKSTKVYILELVKYESQAGSSKTIQNRPFWKINICESSHQDVYLTNES